MSKLIFDKFDSSSSYLDIFFKFKIDVLNYIYASELQIGMYRLTIRYSVSAEYLTTRYYPDPVK